MIELLPGTHVPGHGRLKYPQQIYKNAAKGIRLSHARGQSRVHNLKKESAQLAASFGRVRSLRHRSRPRSKSKSPNKTRKN